MDRRALFSAGLLVAAVCLVIAIVYLVGGTPLGHHIKHALLFFGLAVVAALLAMANRPVSTRV